MNIVDILIVLQQLANDAAAFSWWSAEQSPEGIFTQENWVNEEALKDLGLPAEKAAEVLETAAEMAVGGHPYIAVSTCAGRDGGHSTWAYGSAHLSLEEAVVNGYDGRCGCGALIDPDAAELAAQVAKNPQLLLELRAQVDKEVKEFADGVFESLYKVAFND